MTLDISAKDQLRSYVERAERLNEEKEAISQDLRDLFAEAKGNGFDATAIRTIVKMRKQDTDERREQQQVLETYMHALGMLSDTPLGQAALDRVARETKRTRGRDDKVKVTISVPGSDLPPVETTTKGLQDAAKFAGTPAGRRKIREIAKTVRAEQATPDAGEIEETVELTTAKGTERIPLSEVGQRISDGCAEIFGRNPGNNGGSSPPPQQTPPPQSPPPAVPPAASACSLDLAADGSLPKFLTRGAPECTLGVPAH